jgi:hypothetical protein
VQPFAKRMGDLSTGEAFALVDQAKIDRANRKRRGKGAARTVR